MNPFAEIYDDLYDYDVYNCTVDMVKDIEKAIEYFCLFCPLRLTKKCALECSLRPYMK